MPDDLRLATRAELLISIKYALCFDYRGKATRRNADFMAQMTAEALADMLEQSSYVIMKKPPTPPVDARTTSQRKLT